MALVVGLAVSFSPATSLETIQAAYTTPSSQTASVLDYILCWLFGWNCHANTPPPPPPPTAAISATQLDVPANTSPTGITVPLNSNVLIVASFTPGSGDTVQKSAINGPAPSPLPLGYVWSLAPGLSWTAPVPLTSKTYTFSAAVPGTFVFEPDVYTQVYPSWQHDGGKRLTVTVCPLGASGLTCTVCAQGYGLSGSSCVQCQQGYHSDSNFCVADTLACGGGTKVWDGSAWGTCVCNEGFVWQGDNTCAPAVVPLAIASFTAGRVRAGSAAVLSWAITGMTDSFVCTITPEPPEGQIAWDGGSSWHGSVQTQPVTKTTKFTLSCLNAGDPSASRSVTVTIIPVYKEI